MTNTATRRPRKADAPQVSPGTVQSVTLVAEREIRARLRSKAFLISTGILMLAALASVVIGGILSTTASPPKVAAVGAAQASVSHSGLDVREVGSVAEAKEMVRDGSVDAAVVPDDSHPPLSYQVIALDSPPTDIVQALSAQPHVTLLEPSGENQFLSYLVAIGFGLVFFMSAMTFGTTIAQSVVEEKQTRVVEILMSTIPVRVLLAGKVIGNSILAFAQITAITLLAALGMMTTGQKSLLASLGASLVWFVIFFVFGFVLLAALYAATASLVSRQEDVGSATSPVMILVMLPYILIIVFHSNPVILGIMSYVPFSAPVGMPMRLFLGQVQWWEPLVSLAILLASTLIVIVFGARIYSNSLLRMGARVKLRDALMG